MFLVSWVIYISFKKYLTSNKYQAFPDASDIAKIKTDLQDISDIQKLELLEFVFYERKTEIKKEVNNNLEGCW